MKAKLEPTVEIDDLSRQFDLRLREAADTSEREAAFKELVKLHGQSLVSVARRQAFVLGLDTTTAGDAAMGDAFIRLTESLDDPWPQEKSFLLRFRGEIWNELRHQRAKVAKRRSRFAPLNGEDREAPVADPERQYCYTEQLQLIWKNMNLPSRSNQQLRLARAWRLSKLGYEWGEVKRRVEWSGSCDSLRVSVSRFFNQLGVVSRSKPVG